MKTSYLKNFFNSKENGSKSNFNIHSVDLDDSDDMIVCNESFFQRNNSKNQKEILKSNFMKKNENLNDKKVNLFSLNDTLNSNCEIKSPVRLNNFNLTKLRQSPLNSPLFDREKSLKNINNLEFVVPTSNMNVLKTPKKDEKVTSFQSFKSKGLNSPSVKFMNVSNIFEGNKNTKIRNTPSPPKMKMMSPSITKLKSFGRDESVCNTKITSINVKNDINDKISKLQKNPYLVNDKHEKDFENFDKVNKPEDFKHENQSQSLVEISNLIYENKIEESQCSVSEIDSTEADDNKLKILHLKLKLESEKIQKWRDNIEKELLLKTKKISESDKIIESLRSSNLELQMRQESISLNYREEIESRSEISKKIENSRQLCNILKEKIDDIEYINQNYNKENENLKIVQEQILYIINFVSDDVKNLSDAFVQYLSDLNNKISFKEREIEKLTNHLVEEKKFIEIKAEKYNIEIIDLKEQLKKENENYNKLIVERDIIISEKVEFQNMLFKEKNMSESYLKEKDDITNTFSNLKILYDETIEKNLNLFKDIDIKENFINQLNSNLSELQLEFLNHKNESNKEKMNFEICLKEKEEIIFHLTNDIYDKEQEIKISYERLKLNDEEMNVKVSMKEASIENLTKNIIEKEKEISNLEALIQKLNEDMTKIVDSLSNLKIENDATVKNASILKSSNQDLREELNNYKSEINEQSEQVILLRKEIEQLNIKNIGHLDETNQCKKVIEELKKDNSILKSDLNDTNNKLDNISNVNYELQKSYDKLNETSTILLSEKNLELKDLANKFDSLILIKKKVDADLENKSVERNIFENELNVERKENGNLIQTCKELRILMSTKETDLLNIIAEKEQLSTLNTNLSTRNEEYDNKIKNYEALYSEYKSKISSLESFVEDLSKDKQNILKSREDLRKELMFTLEQCKNDHDIIEKKRNKEIETLKTQINSMTTNSTNNTKKSKNKIADLQVQISQQNEEFDNLQTEMKNILAEKNLLSKNYEISNISIKELSNSIELKDKLFDEISLEKQNLKDEISEYESKVSNMTRDLVSKNKEISKLKEIEVEYEELKLSATITRSPPMTTQIPDYIKNNGSATPKSTRLSTRLSSLDASYLDGQMTLVDKQTPQKTPKGILRQHGSASKRRRVIFEDTDILQEGDNDDDGGSLLSERVDIDLETINKINKKKKNTSSLVKSPTNSNLVTTPKKTNMSNKLGLSDSRFIGRLNNIRKTPSKAPSKLNDKHKKDDKNWFDSDNFFGVTEP